MNTRMPGFTAALALKLPVRTRGDRLSMTFQLSTAVVPAAIYRTWPCYSRADGSTGWCNESCDMNGCVYWADP